MNDLRTAAQQALEALEAIREADMAGATPKMVMKARSMYEPTITALRAALTQEQAEPPGCEHCNHPLYAATKCRVCGRVTEQAESVEPVAKVELMTTGGNAGLATRIVEIDDHLRERLRPGQLLYTAPPQREPLTEEEIDELSRTMVKGDKSVNWLCRAVERAHGIGGQE